MVITLPIDIRRVIRSSKEWLPMAGGTPNCHNPFTETGYCVCPSVLVGRLANRGTRDMAAKVRLRKTTAGKARNESRAAHTRCGRESNASRFAPSAQHRKQFSEPETRPAPMQRSEIGELETRPAPMQRSEIGELETRNPTPGFARSKEYSPTPCSATTSFPPGAPS